MFSHVGTMIHPNFKQIIQYFNQEIRIKVDSICLLHLSQLLNMNKRTHYYLLNFLYHLKQLPYQCCFVLFNFNEKQQNLLTTKAFMPPCFQSIPIVFHIINFYAKMPGDQYRLYESSGTFVST